MKRLAILIAILFLSGCANTVSYEDAALFEKVGFWHGLWHGLIIIFSWVGSLFSEEVAIYAIYNNGGWYDFGFVLGVGGLGFSSGFFNGSK